MAAKKELDPDVAALELAAAKAASLAAEIELLVAEARLRHLKAG